MNSKFDYLQLHFIVLLGSFIPTVVKIIDLPSVEIAILRVFFAMLILIGIIIIRKQHKGVPKNEKIKLISSGFLLAIYWVLLPLSAKLSNPSVTLVGISTAPLFVSFISPFIVRKKLDFYQVITGLNAVFGAYMIFSTGFEYASGFIVAIMTAFFTATLTVINSMFIKKYSFIVISFYQMIGALIIALLFLPIYSEYISEGGVTLISGWADLGLIIATAIFSIFIYSLLINVMKTVPPFTVALTSNLSPVYGILLALLIRGNDEMMTVYFYGGAYIIIFSVIAYPLVQYFFEGSEEG